MCDVLKKSAHIITCTREMNDGNVNTATESPARSTNEAFPASEKHLPVMTTPDAKNNIFPQFQHRR